MTPAAAGLAIAAIFFAASQEAPAPAPTAGARVESDSFTAPREVARCIAYNIGRKLPELRVRSRLGETPEESGYLILTTDDGSPRTFGVIRIDGSEAGSHLTTWLPDRSLTAAPEDMARRLIAGC